MIEEKTNTKRRTQVLQHLYSQRAVSYSHKYKTSAVFESRLEAIYFNLHHFSCNSPHFEVQPCYFYYTNSNGKRCKYTPDFRYVDENGEEHIVETKYTKELEKPDVKQKMALLSQIFQEKGIHFHIVDETEMLNGELESNLMRIKRFLSYPIPIKEFYELYSQLNFNSAPMTKWRDSAANHGFNRALISKAIAHKLLLCDISKPWSELFLSVNQPLVEDLIKENNQKKIGNYSHDESKIYTNSRSNNK